LVKGSLVIFDMGLMYLGTSFGNLNSKSGKMMLLAQASHYAVIAVQNTMYTPVVDYSLSGQVDLTLSFDYFTGLIMASGDATFARSEPLAPQLTDSTGIESGNTRTATNSGSSSSSTRTGTTSDPAVLGPDNVLTSTVLVELLPDGSTRTTTTTSSTTNAGPDVTNSDTNSTSKATGTSANTTKSDINALRHNIALTGGATAKDSNTVSVETTAGLKPGMAISGPGIPNGATIVNVISPTSIQLSKPATADATGVSLAANSESVIFLTMTAEGMREELTVSALPVFTPPSTQVFQIGVNQTGVAGGAPAAGA